MAYLSADERRTKILDAAIDVIAEEGLAKATTRRIAERADAPLGALHYCFRNKKELILVVADRAAATISSAFESVDPSRGVEQTIRDCVDCFWTWMRENPGLQLACMELLMLAIREMEGDDDGLYARVYDPGGANLLRRHLSSACDQEGIELAISIDEIVRFIIHRFDGLIFELAASRDEAACRRQTELLADALIAVALPDSAGTSGRGNGGSASGRGRRVAARSAGTGSKR